MFDDNDNTNLPPNINVCRGWTQIALIFAKIFQMLNLKAFDKSSLKNHNFIAFVKNCLEN